MSRRTSLQDRRCGQIIRSSFLTFRLYIAWGETREIDSRLTKGVALLVKRGERSFELFGLFETMSKVRGEFEVAS
jgi:hypothetical protein